jgi:DNA-binding transcriptional regulator YhcF (GntR family)
MTRRLNPGDRLPSQNELASRYGVARMTATAAIDLLDREHLVTRRQGSGVFVRTRTARPVGLQSSIEAAFGQPKVTIDYADMSGAALYDALSEGLDEVRNGRLRPESIRVRALIADAIQATPNPRTTAAAETAEQRRTDRSTRRTAPSFVDSVTELADLGLIKDATVEIRAHDLAPMFQVFIVNGNEVFFSYRDLIDGAVDIGGDDLPSKETTLFRFTTAGASSQGPAFVEQTRSWFESVWSTIAREYQP